MSQPLDAHGADIEHIAKNDAKPPRDCRLPSDLHQRRLSAPTDYGQQNMASAWTRRQRVLGQSRSHARRMSPGNNPRRRTWRRLSALRHAALFVGLHVSSTADSAGSGTSDATTASGQHRKSLESQVSPPGAASMFRFVASSSAKEPPSAGEGR
jgi:hypothetical protein